MRLIGGKDYYDGGAGFDTDSTRVFRRENFNKATASDESRLDHLAKTSFAAYAKGERRWNKKEIPMNPIYVVFCGTLYSGAVYQRDDYSEGMRHTYYDTAWTAEAIVELAKELGGTFDAEERWSQQYHNYISRDKLDQFVEPKVLTGTDAEFFILRGIPVSIGMYSRLHREHRINWFDNTDGLKAIGFARVIDTWQAYQQLDQFIGSQLAREEDNMVRLSDAELIAKHGFDEFNFRNQVHPGKPRNKT